MDEEFVDLYLHGSNIEDSILTNPIELFFQEIELSMKILPNEVWGISKAINVKRYVFNPHISITQIRNEILNFIAVNCEHAKYFNYTLSVDQIKSDSFRDMVYCLFEIQSIDVDGNQQPYRQKFLLGS